MTVVHPPDLKEYLVSNPTEPAVVTSDEPQDLRQAKKSRTRAAIAAAAAELVLDGGIDSATVASIASRAGVSVRTFHNYFPSRGEALLFHLIVTSEFIIDGLEEHLVGDTMWEALEHAVMVHICDLHGPSQLLAIIRLMEHLQFDITPSTEHQAEAEQVMVRLLQKIGHGLGLDEQESITSILPRLYIETAFNAVQAAYTTCLIRGEDPGQALPGLMTEAFAALRALPGGPDRPDEQTT